MRIASTSTLLVALLFGIVSACGSAASNDGPRNAGGKPDASVGGNGGGSDGDAGLFDGEVPVTSPLRIDPASYKTTPPDGQPAIVTYKAFFTPEGGTEGEVTSQTSFSVDPPDFGTFQLNQLTVTAGTFGQATVHALYKGETATATVTVTKKTIVIDPTAPADAGTKFGGAVDPGQGPQVVYPSSGIVIPPNLNTLEVHWLPAAGQDLFAIDFDGPAASFTAFTGCQPVNGGCVYNLPPDFWASVADQSRGTAPVKWHVRGVSSASPGAVGQSPDAEVSFTNEDLTGGIYYWNDLGSIMRFDFGLPGAPPEVYLPGNPIACVGCHALSRDGSRIVAGTSIPGIGPYTVYDVATTTPAQANGQPITGSGAFFAFSPDGSKLLVADGFNGIFQRDMATGVQAPMPLVPGASLPDWSPDGKEIVYAQAQVQAPTGVSGGTISKMPWDGTTAGPATTLVPSQNGNNNYYPAFTPDQNWISFNRSMNGHNSYANIVIDSNGGPPPDGTLWVVPESGGQPAQLLNATGGELCTWAKWVPSVLTYEKGPIMFLTYSSRRAYGLRLGPGQATQLWLASFDGAKQTATGDGSFSAIWLPFQDMGSGNHIAQWVTKVQRKPCTADSECGPTERCENGVCIPTIH